MKFLTTSALLFASLLLSSFVGAAPTAELVPSNSTLEKRQTYYTGEASYYYVNGDVAGDPVAGACGQIHYDYEQVVALPESLWNDGAYCGTWITIWANSNPGNSQGAMVVDLCPGCEEEHGSGAIDLSPSLFELFAPESAGLVKVTYFLQAQG